MSRNNRNKMDSGNNASGDLELIDLDEVEDEELVREKLRNWALQYSKGASGQTTTNPNLGQDEFEEAKSQASILQGHEPPKYQFPDWSQHIAKDPEKKPPRPSNHSRHTSNHKINFMAPRTSTPVPRNNVIPPVPPIPERWRAEWELQEKKRRAELETQKYPELIPGKQKARLGRKYVREPQLAYPTPTSGDAANNEAAKKANQRRRKAFDAVVLEDQQYRGRGRGNEDERIRDQGMPGDKQFVRPDVRLPRSPGMLNLAQEKLKGGSGSPDTTWPRNSPQEAVIDRGLCDMGQNVKEVEDHNITDRASRDMARSYARSMAIVSEAIGMEFKDEERETTRNG